MQLPALYHWSPTIRRADIEERGLRIYSPSVVHSDPELLYPYICFGTTPSNAWGLSADVEWSGEIEEWDLWQHWAGENERVHVLPTFGGVIQEVRIASAIMPSDLWFVGTRDRYPEVMIAPSPPKPKRKQRKKS